MYEIQHRNLCEHLLIQACQTTEEIWALDKALDNISKDLAKYSLVDIYEATMNTEWYYNASKLISHPKNTIIVDCGCCCGLQQVFFNNYYKYIGIDVLNNFQKICNNAEFYNENIETAIPKIWEKEFNPDDLEKMYTVEIVAISHLCCSVWKEPRDILYKFCNKVINL